jgi:hypothetical protein
VPDASYTTTGTNLFHLVAATPTSFNEWPDAKSTEAFVAPASIDSPVVGYILIVFAESLSIVISNPAAVSGSLTP